MSELFARPTRDQWVAQATKALKGADVAGLTRTDADGLGVAPLYTADDAVAPVFAPRASDADGRAWDLRTLIEGDDAEAVNVAALADLEGGAASLILSGTILSDSEPLARALDGVALELAAVGLDAGLDGPAAADALAVVAKGSPRAMLRFHMDPLSAFAATGLAPRPIKDHLTLAANTAARHAGAYPEASFFLASGRVVHEAGGSAGQELGFAAASALVCLKAGVAAGLGLEQAARGTVLCVSVDAECFDALSRVRALRLIWRSLVKALGLDVPATIEARSSRRMLSARDPWPNLLRLTAAGFAGAVGGADAVVLDGFSRAAGRPDAFARRLARNTQLVLMEEANLGRVDDPASGSWFLDARTRDLAEAGWAEFQRIEGEGGVIAALKAGTIQARVAAARALREADLAEGRTQLIGVTKFVNADTRAAPVEAETAAAVSGGGDVCQPLTPVRFAAPFEIATQEAAR
ncbi:methylmalonyl-CoA mutase family protein [Brevundimonas sp.]|uniref:methylmalonyl-CoA mutase family protein n=1 Tax=Brevundimonas sp. TaxID=1871086 RepID=UPI00248A360D|nr:methylmalonyl-CoA mutase family protein [Brevundimonas sp.]MDI1282666.1 methylmalonyl-CoA mutase family protein [Brevundimonas sp.]